MVVFLDATLFSLYTSSLIAYWDVVSYSLDYGEESRVEKSLRARL